MQIAKFSATNYKSIRELTAFELSDGFNIVTGQNAAGKTALLELLSLNFSSNPHRSLEPVINFNTCGEEGVVEREDSFSMKG